MCTFIKEKNITPRLQMNGECLDFTIKCLKNAAILVHHRNLLEN